MGFEPMVQKKLHVDLANQCLKPLSHFSFFAACFTTNKKTSKRKVIKINGKGRIRTYVDIINRLKVYYKRLKKVTKFFFTFLHIIISFKTSHANFFAQRFKTFFIEQLI